MKCPWRKVTKESRYKDYHGEMVVETETSFEDCYAEDCPCYVDDFSWKPHCIRAEVKEQENERR